MIVSINQPAYLPWLGYFDRIARSDLHIVLDHVQFEKNSFTNRNKIKTSNGPIWLTVPILSKGMFGNLGIDTLQINNQENWQRKHWAAIEQSYKKCNHFSKKSEILQKFYQTQYDSFIALLKEMTSHFLEQLKITTPIVYSSEMGVDGKKDELVLNLCREVKATRYISGPLGRNYLKPDMFAEEGIDLLFHDYQHPVYSQKNGNFLPFMGIIDLLMNEGDNSLEILKNNAEFQQ